MEFDAQVVRVTDLTHDVREIELGLEDPAEIAFLPGQFVSFEVRPEPSRCLTRPYSIASPPERRTSIDLLFNRVPGGPGSSHLFALETGDRVRFRGPAGTCVLREYPDRDLLFVATGTGIAPMRSMILSRLASGTARRVTLIWGLRSERDLYYQDQFRSLAARHPNFSFVTTLSQPSEDWSGPSGRVQPVVEERVESVAALAVYVCGGSRMIADVTEIVRRKGLCPIHREQYYRDQEPPIPSDAAPQAGEGRPAPPR